MKINLEDFVDKKVKVTLQDGRIREGIVKFFSEEDNTKKFFIKSSWYVLNDFDKEGNSSYNSRSNIIHIKELQMNTKEILDEINKTKVQLHLLEEKLKQAEEQEKFNSEFYTPIADETEYKECLKFLKRKSYTLLIGCFGWDQTPQGIEYWSAIQRGENQLSDPDYQQIKDWVINYLIKKESI